MPHAATHVIATIVLLSLYQVYLKNKNIKFSFHYIIIGGISSLIPDLDVVMFWILSYSGFVYSQVHRTFTHTLALPLFFLVLSVSAKTLNKNPAKNSLNLASVFAVISFAIFIHLVLDAVIVGSISPFFPFSRFQFGISLLDYFPEQFQPTILPSLDALVLILWLIYLESKHKISKFI